MPLKKIKILIVDDSIFFRKTLQKALETDKLIEVIGCAENADQAKKMLEEITPDVITLDVEMPGKRGPDFVRETMPKHPIPVVLVSSVGMSVFEALQCGAIDFVKKPDMTKESEFSSFINELCVKIKIAFSAKVKISFSMNLTKLNSIDNKTSTTLTINRNSGVNHMIVAIGASTGGTEATLEILKELPENFPPVLVTQHMPSGFTNMYAERLNRICKIRVKEAVNGMRVEQGLAIIAEGSKHMKLEKDAKGYFIRSVEGEKVSGHCPSVDVLFESVAKNASNNAIGVILTGMGRDGASGLLKMKQSGAYTIGQNKETCVVYGMPMVANQIGAVIREVPIQNIAGMLIKRINETK